MCEQAALVWPVYQPIATDSLILSKEHLHIQNIHLRFTFAQIPVIIYYHCSTLPSDKIKVPVSPFYNQIKFPDDYN